MSYFQRHLSGRYSPPVGQGWVCFKRKQQAHHVGLPRPRSRHLWCFVHNVSTVDIGSLLQQTLDGLKIAHVDFIIEF